MATLWQTIILFFTLLHTVYSFSACDEIDITFVIDTDSIRANPTAIMKFITSIIWSGSSEHSGFSAVIYGDLIPIEQHIKILSLYDTQSTVIRQNEEKLVEIKLRKAFNEFKKGNSETKSVDLVSAFKIATGQAVPEHKYTRKQLLGYDSKDKTIGDHDGQKVYIIFDHKNKLLKNTNQPDICNLFYHLDHNAIKNDDEAAYFMLGDRFMAQSAMNIQCNGHPVSYIKYNTFHYFRPEFANNDGAMESIYMLTCPAEIKSSDYNGEINVGNHVQYIDASTVISCDLFYWDHDKNEETPDELDRRRSHITIKDYINDDNTFKIFDYLIASPQTFKTIHKKGCRSSVYKIVQIQRMQTIYGKTKKEKYKIIRAFVRLPDTPMEYMCQANINGKVPIHTQESHKKGKTVNPDEKQMANPKETIPRPIVKKSNINAAHALRLINNYKIFDEIDILRGEMDDLMSDNPILKQISYNILKYRMQKLRKIAERAVHAKKIALRLLSQWRKRRHISKGVFGAKLMEQEFLGKVGRAIGGAFKKVGSAIKKNVGKVFKKVRKVVKGVVKHVGNLVRGKVAFNKRYKLVDLKFKKDWTFIKTGVTEKTFGSSKNSGFKMIIRGDGTMELKFGFHFKLEVGVFFDFYWKIFKGDVRVKFKIYGQWDIGAYFNAKFIGKLSILFDNILNFGKTKVFFIGPVPVVVRPYVIIYAEIVTLPLHVYGGINCQYSERIELGYEYNRKGRKGPIKTRRIIQKGCTKQFGIGDKTGNDLNSCPIEKLGFDVKLSVKIGCSLYVIINVFLRMEFILPFRITLPQMDPKMCKLPIVKTKGNQMCRRKYLKVAFSISMHMNLYLGASLDIGKIWNFVKKLMFKKKAGGKAISPKTEKKIIGPITIIPKKSLGCLDLKGILLPLNDQYMPKCCKPPPKPPYVIGMKPQTHPRPRPQPQPQQQPRQYRQVQRYMPQQRYSQQYRPVNMQQYGYNYNRQPMYAPPNYNYNYNRPFDPYIGAVNGAINGGFNGVVNGAINGGYNRPFNQGYGPQFNGYGQQQQFNMYGQSQYPNQNGYGNQYQNGYNNGYQNTYGNTQHNMYGNQNAYGNGNGNGNGNRYSNYGHSPLNRQQMNYQTPNDYQNHNGYDHHNDRNDHDYHDYNNPISNDNDFKVTYEYAYENPVNIMSSQEDSKQDDVV